MVILSESMGNMAVGRLGYQIDFSTKKPISVGDLVIFTKHFVYESDLFE
jgi:hypothetical protein